MEACQGAIEESGWAIQKEFGFSEEVIRAYGVYDWDRVDENGNRRALHVEKAMQVIDFAALPAVCRAEPGTGRLTRILECSQFELFEARLGHPDRGQLPA